MSDSSDSSSDHGMPSRGVIRGKNRGWQGEDMELAHAATTATADKDRKPVAVDLSQFRNHQIGQGYQAKFVVRQRTGNEEEQGAIQDMTQKSEKRKKSKRKRSKDNEDNSKTNKESNRIDKYLKCEGFRRFRKELEKFS